jgi:pyruvate dehydrogenase E1 component beta subunit
MDADPKVMVMGHDVGRLGGVFRVTEGLKKDFGSVRVIDTPLAESAIVGTAIGLALRGYRPICEIQFDGFVYPAFNQIDSQLAKIRARTRGAVATPVVIRIPVGGGIGAVEHHSESNEAYFAHTAGLRVYCANPEDAYWTLREAVCGPDPVIFYEPKRLYWTKDEVRQDPGAGSTGRSNRARIAREATDVTLVCWARVRGRSHPAGYDRPPSRDTRTRARPATAVANNAHARLGDGNADAPTPLPPR